MNRTIIIIIIIILLIANLIYSYFIYITVQDLVYTSAYDQMQIEQILQKLELQPIDYYIFDNP